MNVENHAIHLLIADKLNNNEKYTEVAENSAHYLMRRNMQEISVRKFTIIYYYNKTSVKQSLLAILLGVLSVMINLFLFLDIRDKECQWYSGSL